MPFINPYQYGGGVKFNVHAVHELPPSAKSDDIYLVFAEGTPLPDVSNIKTVALFAKFDSTLGNIYPDNTVVLFAYDGAFGTATMTVDVKGLKVDMPIATGASIVNLNGLQVECDVAVYLDGQWTRASYYKLPFGVTEKLDFATFFGSHIAPDVMAKFRLEESFGTHIGVNSYTDTFNIATFFGTHTAPDIISGFNLTETATYSTGGEPIPIT